MCARPHILPDFRLLCFPIFFLLSFTIIHASVSWRFAWQCERTDLRFPRTLYWKGLSETQPVVCLTSTADEHSSQPLRMVGWMMILVLISLTVLSDWLQQATPHYLGCLPCAHQRYATKRCLAQKKIDSAVIPGGCTFKIQIADVSFNKTFKAKITDL